MLPCSQVLDKVFGDVHLPPSHIGCPTFNLAERSGEYVLIVELSGVEPDAVDLSVEKNVLTVRGVKQPSFSRESNRDIRVYALETEHLDRSVAPCVCPTTSKANASRRRSRNGISRGSHSEGLRNAGSKDLDCPRP
jgi:HSP20 family molecular chaperone IbpA